MPVITLTLNGELISGVTGQTLLEVIEEHGVDIPPSAILTASASGAAAASAWSTSTAV